MSDRSRRGPLIAALVIGLGLAGAPAIFQMFTRAPMGATMIDDFRPYMDIDLITSFQDHIATIDAANSEHIDELQVSIIASGTFNSESYDSEFSSAVGLTEAWPGIVDDMGDLLIRMENNIGNYAAVDALPNFKMFPWFFVFPGLIIAGLAVWALRTTKRVGSPTRRQLIAIIFMGLAVVAAPGIFQMFSRAPKGGDMINDFRPMMTRDRVLAVQGYFITLGAAEGQFRINLLPLEAELTAASESEIAAQYPALSKFSEDWPEILTDFAPMISTMSDNVDNFAAVDAMPPFALFPWFFVFPGLLVAGAGIIAVRSSNDDPDLLSIE